MSFNIQHCLNYVDRKIDFHVIADAIKKIDPDIVGLNEVRNKGIDAEYDDQTTILAELTNMKYHYFAKSLDVNGKNPYGNAILSKVPILSSETIIIPDPETKVGEADYETRCLLKAKLDGGITVLITHFGLNPDEQKNAVDKVVENIEKEKCVLMGDFNVTPENVVLKPIRGLLNDTADCFGNTLLSYPSDNPNRKIDYLFTSRDIEILSADIPGIVASDHRPHIATINIDMHI